MAIRILIGSLRVSGLLVIMVGLQLTGVSLAAPPSEPSSKQSSDQPSPRKVALDVAISDPVMLSEKKQTTHVKVGLQGFPLPSQDDRPAVNIALVIDRSGSMRGDKIEKAKQAAMAAIDRLRASDIVSVIAYDQGVQVILPATKLTDKEFAKSMIRNISAGGSTALFAGVCKGAAEVRKFLDKDRVNRVILLSDGQANVGPALPSELGDLGESLLKERIAVTTLGLGLDYNEDLMTQLAVKSNGNHLFIEQANEMLAVFDHEFNDVLSVVAQEITINIAVREGVRPVRVLGQDADIHGQNVMVQLNQIYANQERFILMEVEVPATAADATRKIADVSVSYANMLSKSTDTLKASTSVKFDANPKRCADAKNKDVLEKWVLLEANEKSLMATKLRDMGKVEEARQLLMANDDFLRFNARQLDSDILRFQEVTNRAQVSNLENDWKKTRKLMRRDQQALQSQAPGYGYSGGGYGGGYGSSTSDGASGYGGGGYGGGGDNQQKQQKRPKRRAGKSGY